MSSLCTGRDESVHSSAAMADRFGSEPPLAASMEEGGEERREGWASHHGATNEEEGLGEDGSDRPLSE